MSSFFSDVVEFNQAVLGIPPRVLTNLTPEEAAISCMSLNEELVEWTDAVVTADTVGQVDALIDLMYFATGVLYKLGLSAEQIEQCASAVHAANMTKRRGTNAKRDTGAADAVKPDGWVAPEQRIATILGVSE